MADRTERGRLWQAVVKVLDHGRCNTDIGNNKTWQVKVVATCGTCGWWSMVVAMLE